MAHTPTPWGVRFITTQDGTGGTQKFKVYGGQEALIICQGEAWTDTDRANARIVAAAAAMFELFCNYVELDECSGREDDGECNPDDPCLFCRSMALIAQVHGEEVKPAEPEQTPSKKIGVRSITITRGEGPIDLCDKPRTFASWGDAETWLRSQGHTFPKDGTYDKHNFIVTFEDAETWEGRLDCKHPSCRDNDLDVKEHIRSLCEWHGGVARHPWCGAQKYAEIVATYQDKQDYLDFLNKYDI